MLLDILANTVLSAIIVMLVLIGAIIAVIVTARRQSLQQQLKEAEYRKQLSDTALASLRAQMNPHFIFNCLNSIKLYTEQNDNTAASEYLGKFARLIRSMLDKANVQSTTLASELETLRLYMDMETMRFKEKMSYNIIVDKNVDTDFVEIPPLLIQPYVENAIWHGIMHKAENGNVTVRIHQREDNTLEIIIEDDGIGRERAAALKKGMPIHRSYGTQITGDRISLLNEKNENTASVTITDLYPDQEYTGTKVIIKLPIK